MAQPSVGGIHKTLTSYGNQEFSRFMRRAFLASAGYDASDLERPIIGIADSSSDYNLCHRSMPSLVDAVKRGVLEAGGLPFAFPQASWHEILTSPTTMLFRNLMAMELEELLLSQPMDAVVLLGGCDKTVPAQLMAAVSADIPALSVVVGPMRTGSWRGERLGACTDCRRLFARHRAGELSTTELLEVEQALCPTAGTCMVMGTASTMACVTEALGFMLPGGATAPADSGARLRHGVLAGRQAVANARAGLTPSRLLSKESFHNALVMLMALGGSTNVIIHLLALARRAGVPLSLDDVEAIAFLVPLLVDCKPSGRGYLEDLHHAGGVPALMTVLKPLLETSAATVTGERWASLLTKFTPPGAWQTTIRTLEDPLGPTGALAVLKGNLAPEGAVLKASASSPALCQHRGPAVVFESAEDVAQRIDDPDLAVTPDSVLVLRNAGPVGAGMPEAGSIPIPKKLAEAGVKDMVRISDARMSGTAYGTVVLHCAPEAAVGGPLAAVKDGDLISLELAERRITLHVPQEELEARLSRWRPTPLPARGWRRLYAQHVEQASLGADLDFLAANAKIRGQDCDTDELPQAPLS